MSNDVTNEKISSMLFGFALCEVIGVVLSPMVSATQTAVCSDLLLGCCIGVTLISTTFAFIYCITKIWQVAESSQADAAAQNVDAYVNHVNCIQLASCVISLLFLIPGIPPLAVFLGPLIVTNLFALGAALYMRHQCSDQQGKLALQ